MIPEVQRGVQLYLQRATSLLPAAVADRVREELYTHLHLDALDAQMQGLDESLAWHQALKQAGPVWLTALRFARIYSLGPVLRLTLAGLMLGGAAYAVQAQTHWYTQPAPGPVQQGQP